MSLKEWLKDNYKILICGIIYNIIIIISLVIIINLGTFVDSIYIFITAGIVIICLVIYIIFLEYQIKKDNKKKEEYN